MASTSLPLAAAAAVATLLAAPAGAAPGDQPTTPASPAPVQPGTETPENVKPETEKPTTPGQTQPGTPSTPESTTPGSPTTPSQPGITNPSAPQTSPSQPGISSPRKAPLPVPGQTGAAQPAVSPDKPGTEGETKPGEQAQPANTPEKPGTGQGTTTPSQPGGTGTGAGTGTGTDTLVQEQAEDPGWQAPRLANAPAAPVVEMTGPHQEIGANVDGGGLLPGYVANTHHFNSADGYVGTIGYRTPSGFGDAGVSVEYFEPNAIRVTTFTGGDGRQDLTAATVLDTTQVNLAKAAVEGWIKAQPGGAAALEAVGRATLPVPGESAQTVNVGGVTTQWGGSLQY